MKTLLEKLNNCVFSTIEQARIDSETPADGIPIRTANGFELAAWRMPNGSTFVVLKDGSNETWLNYCAHLLAYPRPTG